MLAGISWPAWKTADPGSTCLMISSVSLVLAFRRGRRFRCGRDARRRHHPLDAADCVVLMSATVAEAAA